MRNAACRAFQPPLSKQLSVGVIPKIANSSKETQKSTPGGWQPRKKTVEKWPSVFDPVLQKNLKEAARQFASSCEPI